MTEVRDMKKGRKMRPYTPLGLPKRFAPQRFLGKGRESAFLLFRVPAKVASASFVGRGAAGVKGKQLEFSQAVSIRALRRRGAPRENKVELSSSARLTVSSLPLAL